jgi:hypothetical protein
METEKAIPSATSTSSPAPGKKNYVSPMATFVPFKHVERLSFGSGCDPTTCTEGSYIK